ncbi:Nucleoside diphosphate kinase [bioreactor metagenome]|uniref:Nucleoside diphosphate kinase n=1 Tax=bioreactor metagenome TaxID=1076179 RepID=A0A645AV17_9ZZZZ
MEKTLVLVKPDGVEKGVCGDIINRFERRGLKISGLKLLNMSAEQAELHYKEHVGKRFYDDLISYIMSGPVLAAVLTGENAVKIVRTMMGPTNPAEAAPGTIRGDLGLSIEKNIIHGSDSISSADREIEIFFNKNELI